MVINSNEPFAKYKSSDGNLAEVDSGFWYQQAYSNMFEDLKNECLMPIFFAMDKTTISNSAHLHAYLIMFTTTIFKRHIRTKAAAWGTIGIHSYRKKILFIISMGYYKIRNHIFKIELTF